MPRTISTTDQREEMMFPLEGSPTIDITEPAGLALLGMMEAAGPIDGDITLVST